MEITKRQRKKRGKGGVRSTGSRVPREREVGFKVGKWVQVYAQAEKRLYWIKIAKLESVRDEERAFF